MHAIATAPVMSPADRAAHRAASYVRRPRITLAAAGFGLCDFCGKPAVAGHACASLSPDVFDVVSPGAAATLDRVTARVAYLLRDRQPADAARREIAEVA